MAFLSASNKLVVTLVVVIMVVVLILGFFLGLQFAVVQVDTTTRSLPADRLNGFGTYNGGPEMLSQSTYISSWSPDLTGQKAVFSAGVEVTGVIGCAVDDAKYLVDINKGVAWERVVEFHPAIPQAVGSKFFFAPGEYALKGIYPDGSGLRVEFSIHCALGSWVALVHDEAHIASGIGSVHWDKDTYAVGEVAVLVWDIPYATDEATGRGWAVHIYGTAQAKDVVGLTKVGTAGSLRGEIRYTVTAADFTVAASCRNELVGILRNELWEKDFDTAVTIDIAAYAPSVRILGFTPLDPAQGDTVKVTWTADKNAVTQLELTKVVVKWGYGGVDRETVLGPTARDYSFVAGSTGTVHFEVLVYDSGCRPAISKIDIHVGEPNGPTSILFLVLVLALAVVVGVLLFAFVRIPLPFRIVVALVPVIVVLVLFVVGVL